LGPKQPRSRAHVPQSLRHKLLHGGSSRHGFHSRYGKVSASETPPVIAATAEFGVTSHLATSTATTTPAVTNGTRVLQFLLAICPRLAQNSSVLSFIPYRSTYEFAPSAARTQRLEPATVSARSGACRRRNPHLLLCLLLTIAVLVCYNPVVHNGFLNYDDDQYITNNAHVRAA